MDMVDSTKRDKAYIKYKVTVKSWENEFKTKFARTPSKFDIKEAPSKIKYAYKKYFQLKSAALEDSLSICDSDYQSFGSPDNTQHLSSCKSPSPQLEVSSESEPMLPSLPTGQEIEKLLLKADNKEKKAEKLQSLSTNNLSKKLFQNSKFSLRNPRKLSLSKSQLLLEDKVDKESKELTQDVFKNEFSDDSSKTNVPVQIDNGPSLCHRSLHSDLSYANTFDFKVKSPSVRQVNEGWLNRATNSFPSTCEQSTLEEKFGVSNIINKQNNTNIHADKINEYVENSESETEGDDFNKLKPALKKRKINECNDFVNVQEERDSGNVQSKSKTKSKHIKEKSAHATPQSSKKSSRRISSTVSIMAENNKPPDILEYVPFGLLEERLTPRLTPLKSDEITNALSVSNKPISNIKSNSEQIEKLEKKISNGTLNENFVKINIEKKVFVRGKKNINYSRYKKQQWKDKKALNAGMEFPESGKISCFKCGGTGHMARYCTAHKGDVLLPLENYDECEIPTLEDMQNIVSKETSKQSLPEQLCKSAYEPTAIPESFLKLLTDSQGTNSNVDVMPIYTDYKQDTPQELYTALKKFEHDSFRPGQKEVIMRILSGKSTLLILSTGGGKSLCYQLPAYIYSQHYKCITLVISPLVSLMEDQVLNMPEFLKAGCLHTNQSITQRRKIIQYLKDGEINILLISPEALLSGDGSNGFTGLFRSLPQIAFACIDEAHCVSQWSHNFRPSYLMISRILREKLNVKCILGLTATASKTTTNSIITHIDVPDGLTGVITNPTLPDNLYLSVSFEKDKDRALVSLLSSERIREFDSIIVYCIRRDECERVAAALRSCLQEPGKINMEKQNNKRKRMSYVAEAYHAGMSAAQRKKIQSNFMNGTLRIIVATVAFGMGINKSDIRCIIHYNTPRSFESYVQEVGRAGRDGKAAYCHVLMSSTVNDKNELLKHIHANTIDRPTIRKLLQNVFIPCKCATLQADSPTKQSNIARCKGHEVGIPIDSTVENLDLPSENIATLLCYVELHHKQYIKVLNNAYTMCKISSYGGPEKILEAAKTCPPLAMAILIESKIKPDITKQNILEFNIIEAAAAIGWESGITKYHLKNLEWVTECGASKRSHLKVEFSTLGFRIRAPGDLSPMELDTILDDLHNYVLTQEKAMLYQLEECYRAFIKLGNYSLEGNNNLSDESIIEKSNELKYIIRNYFQRENVIPTDMILPERPIDSERLISDVRALISSYKDCTFTGRSIAKIFQGISSPNYPAIVWGRCKYWRSHIHEDFYGIMKIATQQIMHFK